MAGEEPAHVAPNRARVREPGRAAARGGVPDLRLPRADRRLGAGDAHHLAAPRSRAGGGGRSARAGAARRGAHRARGSGDRRHVRVRHRRPRGGGVRARGARGVGRPAGAVQTPVDGRDRGRDRQAVPAGADHVLRGARAEDATLTRSLLALGIVLVARVGLFGPAIARADGGVAVDPDAPTVAARAEAKVGDAIHVAVLAIAPTSVPVNLPATLDLGPLTLLDRKESEQNLGDGKVRREFMLTVAAYEPGEIAVPAIDVTYLGPRGDMRTVRTAPVPIKIGSLIANEPEPALKENAVPVSVLERTLWPIYVAGAIAAAALGALITMLIVRRLRARRGARPGPPPRPAHEIALERLDRLGSYGFLENADNRPFYFAVSEVIREYLGARFGFDSLELTTDELAAELRRRAGRELFVDARRADELGSPAAIAGGHGDPLRVSALIDIEGWLSACDLVKFAKVSPSATESRGTLENAIRIVTTTRLVPDPVPASSEARHA